MNEKNGKQGRLTDTPELAAVEDGFASVREAERYLSISRAKLYDLMESGGLIYAKIGRARRIPWATLRQYAARCLVGARAE
jgi:excisionase family DNA binding protein